MYRIISPLSLGDFLSSSSTSSVMHVRLLHTHSKSHTTQLKSLVSDDALSLQCVEESNVQKHR